MFKKMSKPGRNDPVIPDRYVFLKVLKSKEINHRFDSGLIDLDNQLKFIRNKTDVYHRTINKPTARSPRRVPTASALS